MQRVLGELSDGLEEGEGDLRADDRGSLEQTFVLWRQPVDARCQDRLHRCWHLNGRRRLRQARGAALPPAPRSPPGCAAHLQKEGVARGG